MPLTRKDVFGFFEEERGANSARWIDEDMFVCEPAEGPLKRTRPGFNLLFGRVGELVDPEFNQLTMFFRMANVPSWARDWCCKWCEAQQPVRQYTQTFWHDESVNIRHSLLIESSALDRSTLRYNFWAFEDAVEQFDYDIDQTQQR